MRFRLMWLAALFMLSVLLPAYGDTPARLVILYAGDVDGELEPCGCPGSPSGGFARRATLIKQTGQAGHPLLVLDAGNALLRGTFTLEPKSRRRDDQHAGLVASLLAATGTRAAAVGPRDLWAVGVTGLKTLAANTKVPWLSANLVDARGASPFPPSVVLTAGRVRVGVIGLTEPQQMVANREGITFLEAIPAARREAARLKGRVDLLIALSNLPSDLNDDLRAQVRELDLIVTGPPLEGAPLVSGLHAPWTVRVAGQGRALGRLDLWLTPGSSRSLSRSSRLERRLVDLAAARHSLEALKSQILIEEGRPNPKRLEAQGAFLRSRIEQLVRELETADGEERVFAFRHLPLDEEIAADPAIAARIRRYHPPSGRETALPTDSPRF